GCHRRTASGGLEHTRWQIAPKLAGDEIRSTPNKVERNTGLDAEAVQKVNEILRREIARSSGSVGTATKSAGRAVENRESHLESLVDVGDRHSVRVVEMHREFMPRKFLEQITTGRFDVTRSRCTNRVSDRDLVNAELEERGCDIGNFFFAHRTLVRAYEAGRDIPSNGYSFSERIIDDRLENINGFLNAHVDVFLVERFRCGREYGNAPNSTLNRAFQTPHVGDER